MNQVRFKKCRGNRVVELEIIGTNNESRKVHNPEFAKYRCSKARVLKIYDAFNFS